MDVEICVVELSEYLENGSARYVTLELPTTEEAIKAKLSELGGEEYMIVSHDAPFRISEYQNISELNQMIAELSESELSEDEVRAIMCVADTPEDGLNAIRNGNYIIYNVNEEVAGWQYCIIDADILGRLLEEKGHNTLFSQPVPEEMRDYMDYESVFRDLSINDGWRHIEINGTLYLITLQ